MKIFIAGSSLVGIAAGIGQGNIILTAVSAIIFVWSLV